MTTERRDNFYEGAAGKRELGKDREMITATVFAIVSCPKAVTGVTVMPLVEEGKLSLDDPATKFVPEIAEIQVLEGVDDTGEPRVRPTDSDTTVNQMMLHIAGSATTFSTRMCWSTAQKNKPPANLEFVALLPAGEGENRVGLVATP